jgi:hypothetical protein
VPMHRAPGRDTKESRSGEAGPVRSRGRRCRCNLIYCRAEAKRRTGSNHHECRRRTRAVCSKKPYILRAVARSGRCPNRQKVSVFAACNLPFHSALAGAMVR